MISLYTRTGRVPQHYRSCEPTVHKYIEYIWCHQQSFFYQISINWTFCFRKRLPNWISTFMFADNFNFLSAQHSNRALCSPILLTSRFRYVAIAYICWFLFCSYLPMQNIVHIVHMQSVYNLLLVRVCQRTYILQYDRHCVICIVLFVIHVDTVFLFFCCCCIFHSRIWFAILLHYPVNINGQ